MTIIAQPASLSIRLADSLDDGTDLPPLPIPAPFFPIVLACLRPLLAWLQLLLTRALLRRCAHHPLILLQQVFDPAPIVQACAGFYHHSGPGRPPDFSLDLLVRAELLRAWFGGLSNRQLEYLLAADGLARWFAGLALLDPPPDHTTLSRFHAWLLLHQPATVFDHVLAVVDHADPEDPVTTPQLCDTFAMRSAAAPTSPACVLLAFCYSLATTWLAAAPAALQSALPPLDLAALADPPPAFTAEQRAQRRQRAVTLARSLSTGLAPHLPALDPPLRATISQLLTLIAKVISDEYRVDEDGSVHPLQTTQKGHYRLASPVDPDATFRTHGPGKQDFGFNAAIATTKTRIRSAVVLTGSTPDSDLLVPLLRRQKQAKSPLPLKLVMDQAAGQGKTRAQVAAFSDGKTSIVAKVPPCSTAGSARFTPDDFTTNPERTRCRCPHGIVSTHVSRVKDDGVTFSFAASTCAACPLRPQCRDPQRTGSGPRTVFISDYRERQRVAAAFNQTDEGKALLKARPFVEAVIGWLVRYDGCRRARRVGQAAAQGQLLISCAVRNLKSWLGRIRRGVAPPPAGPLLGGVRP